MEKNDFEELDAAAEALKYVRSLPPGIARSQAFKEAGKLRRVADKSQPPKLSPRGRPAQTVGRKRRGLDPPATGIDPRRSIRLSDEFMADVDAWAVSQHDQPSRSKAIRRLVELVLKAKK